MGLGLRYVCRMDAIGLLRSPQLRRPAALFLLMGCVGTAFRVPVCTAQAKTGKRASQPFTLAIGSPHISWGKPWAGAPIHALVVPSISEGRTLIELAERFPFTYDTVAIDSSWDVNSYVGTGKDYGTRTYKELYGNLADDLNSKTHYDVIVLPSLFGWNRLPQEVRDAILKRVKDGAGLVLIHPTTGIPAPDDPKTTRPLRKTTPDYSVAQGGKLWEVSPLVGALSDRLDNDGHLEVRTDAVAVGPWRVGHRSFITANVPFASFPTDYMKHYKYRLGTDSTALVEGPEGEPIVATKMYGKGRVVALGYLNYGLSPEIDWSFLGKRSDHWWEYFYSLLGRSIIWSSHCEPRMTLLPMSVDPNRRMGERLVVPIQNATPVRRAELSAKLFDEWGGQEGAIERKIAVRKGLSRISLILPADLSAGQHFVDVTLSTNGKHYDWGTATFHTPKPGKILTISTDKQFYALGDSLQVTVRTTGEQGAGLRFELLDNRRRLVGLRAESDAGAQDGVIHTALPVGNYSTNIGWIRVALFKTEKGRTIKLDQKQVRVNFVSLDRKFGAYELILPWYGPHYYEPWTPVLEKQLRKIGMTVGANPRDNFKIIASVDAPGFGVEWPYRRSYIEQKDNYLRTLDTKYLVREPDLSSHVWLDKLQGLIIQSMKKTVPYHPLAYYLADESSLTAYDDALDFSWSQPTLVALRQWLQGQYPGLDALNREWETDFKSWNDVVPFTTEQAQAKGDYAGWMDHRTFMEQVFAHAMEVASETVKAEDSAGLSSISGTQVPGPSNGVNWYLLDHAVGYLQPYSDGDQDDLHRSIHAGQVLTGFTGYGIDGIELRHELWHRLFHGQIGASLFWQYTALNADLTMTQQGRDLAALTNEFRDEGLALLLRGAHRDNCGIAVHYSLPSVRGHWITDGHIVPHEVSDADATSANLKRFQRNRTQWLQALRDAGYQYDFMTTEQMDKGQLSNYRVLILPDSIALSKGEVAAIRSFVERGGLLISDGETGLMDGHARWQNGGLLDDILGVHRTETHSEPEENHTAELHARLAGQAATLDVVTASPDLELTTGHAAATSGKTPFLIENSFGAGRSLALNFWLTNYFGHDKRGPGASLGFTPLLSPDGRQKTNNDTALLDVLKGYLGQAGIRPVADVHIADGKPVSCSEVIGYEKDGVHYLAVLPGLGCSDAGSVSVQLPKEEYVYDLRAHGFLGHISRVTGRMDAGSPLFIAVSPTPLGKLSIRPDVVEDGEASVKAGGAIEFAIHESDTSGIGGFPEAVHVEVFDPNGKNVDFYGKNLSLVNGEARFSLATALNESPGVWKVRASEPYTHQSGVATFSVIQCPPCQHQ